MSTDTERFAAPKDTKNEGHTRPSRNKTNKTAGKPALLCSLSAGKIQIRITRQGLPAFSQYRITKAVPLEATSQKAITAIFIFPPN